MRIPRTLLPGLLLITGIVLLSLALKTTTARTITVDDDGGADHETITEALGAAQDSDEIRVYEGVYSENLVLDKTVSLMGNGSANTTIEAMEKKAAIEITANWCNVSGFRVVQTNYERGFRLSSVSHCRIAWNNCSNINRTGIYLSDSHNNDIQNNSFLFAWGDAIALSSSKNNIITHNNYSSLHGDGIWLFSQSHDNHILNNSSPVKGGGNIHIEGGLNNTFSGNTLVDDTIHWRGDLLVWNSQHIDSTNTVNEKPIHYIVNSSEERLITGDVGELILVNCSNMVVDRLSKGSWSVRIGYCSNHV